MTRRLTKFLLATAAAGTMLLTACGQAHQAVPTAATGGNQSAPAAPTVPAVPLTNQPSTAPQTTKPEPTKPAARKPETTAATVESTVEPVDCGPVKLPTGATHTLVADSTTDGRVGCTEAFTVLDEFGKLPAGKLSDASLGDVKLSNGWTCTMDDGETTSVSCVKGKTPSTPGIALHTRPA